ncbi:Anti-sigma-K factor RskA [Actinomadura rubteroloni]|uniref:Regulator of SigK n=1 Tax=Actinomadura rubteroloni TaxID=1926885 RepID=A0A2P4UIN2_9ACTN|nr:anti-sigma factor [Actinomadura rubteroloni]POM24881.1 Anti-sigma-K factor RskA [Actinomadura rubteroloni]
MTDAVHGLAGPYALDALGPDERRDFERHLDGCAVCAAEVGELAETAARLGAAAARPAPAALRARVLAEAARTRQAPPRLPAARTRRLRRIVPALAAAACLVLATGLGAGWYQADRRARHAEASSHMMADMMSAPDARTVAGSVATGGHGMVVMSHDRDAAVVMLSGLDEAPAGRTYAVWLMGDGAPRPAGRMRVADKPAMIHGLGRATGVYVTVEPMDGSAEPAGPEIFTARWTG